MHIIAGIFTIYKLEDLFSTVLDHEIDLKTHKSFIKCKSLAVKDADLLLWRWNHLLKHCLPVIIIIYYAEMREFSAGGHWISWRIVCSTDQMHKHTSFIRNMLNSTRPRTWNQIYAAGINSQFTQARLRDLEGRMTVPRTWAGKHKPRKTEKRAVKSQNGSKLTLFSMRKTRLERKLRTGHHLIHALQNIPTLRFKWIRTGVWFPIISDIQTKWVLSHFNCSYLVLTSAFPCSPRFWTRKTPLHLHGHRAEE